MIPQQQVDRPVDWWVGTMTDAVEEAVKRCADHGRELERLAGGEEKFKEVTGRLVTAANDGAAAVVGLRFFWGQAAPKVRMHRRILAGLAFSACSVAGVLYLLPTWAEAKPEEMPKDPEVLLRRQDYDRAAEVLKDDFSPKGMLLKGELSRAQGDEFTARCWYERSAETGNRAAQAALRCPRSGNPVPGCEQER